MSTETIRLIRVGEKGGKGVWRLIEMFSAFTHLSTLNIHRMRHVFVKISYLKHILLKRPITTELFQKKMHMTLMLATT